MNKKRSIFEDVGTDARPDTEATTGVIDRSARTGARGPVRLWLMVIFVLVLVMVAVGGLTRLTDSGLSITEWAPVTGAVPPLSDEAWETEFEKYKAIPEYQLQNAGMSLAEFKYIYWWEWGHRQLGRLIGLVWAVGFFGFLATKTIPPGWTGRLLLLGVLGGFQGAIGWWMVSSGLEGAMLDVASYRLAVHLGLAFLILGLIAWFLMLLGRSERDLLQARRVGEGRLAGLTAGLLALAVLQVLLGALVAGIDAGRSFIDWPLLEGAVFPPDMWSLRPVWRNFFENAGLVQFNHRLIAYLLLVVGLVVWQISRSSPNPLTKRAFDWMAVMLFGQVVLGIVTVLNATPLHWGLVHQIGAVILIVLTLRARFLAKFPVSVSIRGSQA